MTSVFAYRISIGMANLTAADEALRALIIRLGSQKAAAKHLGISEPYLSDLRKRRRPMSERLLGKLGFQRVVVAK